MHTFKSVAKQAWIALRLTALALVTLFAAVAAMSLTVVPANAASASNAADHWCPVYFVEDGHSVMTLCDDSVGNTRYRAVAGCADGRTVYGGWVHDPWPSVAGCGSSKAFSGNVQFECEGICLSRPSAATEEKYAHVE
ncbi:hypothetical protein [Nonomuraea sp. NPDC049158]|uniref:hypothetical protein n=1 Tax=Nonomuraea sp. NPDC049158 TaxID=3155649 RepID=UPI00340BA364